MNYPNEKFLLVASDVHSNEDVFEKLCTIAADSNCIAFLYAGDLDTGNLSISYALKNRNFVFIPVLGNCDSRYSYIDSGFPDIGTYKICSYFSRKILISHGHTYIEQISDISANKIDIVITGHTHIPELQEQDGIVFLNPGSASIPRGYSKQSYSIITSTEIQLRELSDNHIFERATC